MAGCGAILIVDDDPGYLEFVATVVERAGFATRRELTGEGALAAVYGASPQPGRKSDA